MGQKVLRARENKDKIIVEKCDDDKVVDLLDKE